MKNLSIIAAVDSNMLIGRENHLPWSIKEDMQYFREKTMGHPVVMGKNTWLSLGKPLEGRINIILTHDPDFYVPGCIVTNSIEQIVSGYSGVELFVIGGAAIFSEFLPFANKLYLTRINHSFDGDTYFPAINWDDWELVFFEQKVTESDYQISFETWNRK